MPQKAFPPREQAIDLVFPLQGQNNEAEFGRQPDYTAREGVNVRAYEPEEERGRGGSRPGLSKYIAEQVSGANVIQHLSILVDTDPAAINTDDMVEYSPGGPVPRGGTGIMDTSTNNRKSRNRGRWYRRGGSARQPRAIRSLTGLRLGGVTEGYDLTDGELFIRITTERPGNLNSLDISENLYHLLDTISMQVLLARINAAGGELKVIYSLNLDDEAVDIVAA